VISQENSPPMLCEADKDRRRKSIKSNGSTKKSKITLEFSPFYDIIKTNPINEKRDFYAISSGNSRNQAL
jgi:hypothetical protein